MAAFSMAKAKPFSLNTPWSARGRHAKPLTRQVHAREGQGKPVLRPDGGDQTAAVMPAPFSTPEPSKAHASRFPVASAGVHRIPPVLDLARDLLELQVPGGFKTGIFEGLKC
jgi:hypothetical protein